MEVGVEVGRRATAQPQAAVRQDPALEEGVEPVLDHVLDQARQFGARAGLSVGDEAGGMLLHEPAQRGLLGAVAVAVAVALLVERGAVQRPAGAAGHWRAR